MGEHKTRSRRKSAYFLNFGRALRTGMFFGLAMAAVYCLFVIGLYTFAGEAPFENIGISPAGAVAAYISGGLACGLLYAALHPLGKSFLGAMLLGIPCGIAVVLGVAIAMDGLPTTWTRDEWESVLVLGVLFGGICGPIARSQWSSP